MTKKDLRSYSPSSTSLSMSMKSSFNKVLSMFCVAAIALGAAVLPVTTNASAAGKTNLNYWFWGEGDIPGMNKWMSQRIALYEKANPSVTVTLTPQSNDTLIPNFTLAASQKSGPDVGTQWATLPVLQPALAGAIVPISNYVAKSETAHWLDTAENTYLGKIYAMPLYVIGVPLVWNKKLFVKAGLNPNVAPKTWGQFLTDCAALKAHGIIPFGMGNAGGDFGAWMFAIYEKQALNSISQLTQGVANVGTARKALLASLTKMYTMFHALIASGYVNSNVATLDFAQGWNLFPEGKSAMTLTTDGNALAWAKTLGTANVGAAAPPIWGTGALAKTYDATQSSSEFITSWSSNKTADAKFLTFLHSPANMKALNTETGAFPADNRFPTTNITGALAKQLDGLDTAGPSVWLENFIPPTIDTAADRPAGQVITSGGSVAKAVNLWSTQLTLWQSQQPTQFQQFSAWAKSA